MEATFCINIMQKTCKDRIKEKLHILISKRAAQHPFANQNIQHLSNLFHMCVCLSTLFTSVCLSVHLLVICLSCSSSFSISLSVCHSVSISLPMFLSFAQRFVCLFILCPSPCPSFFHLFVSLSILFPTVCLFVCIPLSLCISYEYLFISHIRSPDSFRLKFYLVESSYFQFFFLFLN